MKIKIKLHFLPKIFGVLKLIRPQTAYVRYSVSIQALDDNIPGEFYIQLFGKLGCTGKSRLTKYQLELFEFNYLFIGEIVKLEITFLEIINPSVWTISQIEVQVGYEREKKYKRDNINFSNFYFVYHVI